MKVAERRFGPQAMLNALLPPICPGCGEAIQGGPFCAICLDSQVLWEGLKKPGVLSFGAYSYGGAVAETLARAKFQADPGAAEAITNHFKRELKAGRLDLPTNAGGITFVPGPWWRVLKRGFDLPRALADVAGAHLGIPTIRALGLHRSDPPLSAGANRQERAERVKGRFFLRAEIKLPESMLLMDDVFTTGATLGEAKKALEIRGARVHACALFVTE
jgi:predicted amidophosphoribosyltransferase